MIKWLKAALFGRPIEIAVPPARPEVAFGLPDGFGPVALGEPVPNKPHYAPPIAKCYASPDGALHLRVMTEHDHDGLEYHRKDAKRGVTEAGGSIAYQFNRDNGYSMAGTLADGSNFHLCVKAFDGGGAAEIIGSVLLTFDTATDPRAAEIIRSATDRLTLTES